MRCLGLGRFPAAQTNEIGKRHSKAGGFGFDLVEEAGSGAGDLLVLTGGGGVDQLVQLRGGEVINQKS